MHDGNAWTSIELMLGSYRGVLYTIRRTGDRWTARVKDATELAAAVRRESPGEALVAICKMIDAGAGAEKTRAVR